MARVSSLKRGVSTVAYNLRFSGQVFDGQAGLHQNWYRDLDPATGKYYFVIDTNPCTSDCTKAHEQQHIADAKAK